MASSVSDTDFSSEVLSSDVPVLVDFWAPWCGPCKAMEPVIEELAAANEGKLKVMKMNVDENSQTPGEFNVTSIPTFVVFKDGKPVKQFVGARSKADMQKELDAVL